MMLTMNADDVDDGVGDWLTMDASNADDEC